jgi:hypothetical protein
VGDVGAELRAGTVCCPARQAQVVYAPMRLELLDRYLGGECTSAERASVERWLAESPARQALLEQLANPGPTASDAQKAEVRARLEREMGSGLKLGGNGT